MVQEVSDTELKKVIGDFLEMGHVDNIVSMFRREPHYFGWTGELLVDERFTVRLGLTIVFEELQKCVPQYTPRAIASLAPVLNHENPLFRGEAVSLLGIIDTDESKKLIESMRTDSSPQVREMVEIALSTE